MKKDTRLKIYAVFYPLLLFTAGYVFGFLITSERWEKRLIKAGLAEYQITEPTNPEGEFILFAEQTTKEK